MSRSMTLVAILAAALCGQGCSQESDSQPQPGSSGQQAVAQPTGQVAPTPVVPAPQLAAPPAPAPTAAHPDGGAVAGDGGEPTAEEIPVPEDFEDEAEAEISADNYRAELDRLASEIGPAQGQ